MNNIKNDKVALITGGAKRLGRVMALHLASLGYNILIHCNKSTEVAMQTSNEIKQFNVNCEIFVADFSDIQNVTNFCNEIKSKNKKIDLLINNAAVFVRKNLEQTNNESLQQIMNVNLVSPMVLIRELAEILKNGQVINITDAKIHSPDSRYFVYSLSKMGLMDLTKLASQEYVTDFRVNCIALGMMLKNEEFIQNEKFIDKIPLKTHISTQNLTKTIDYLINTPFITGQTITVDGGYYNIIR